jgi:hypothetical protein
MLQSMRYLVMGLVFAGSIASAEPGPQTSQQWMRPNTSGVFLDLGGGWERVHPNGYTYRAEYLRIAPAVSLNRFLYLGAAFQFGSIYDVYGAPDRATAAVHASDYSGEGNGSTFAAQVFLGARQFFGIVAVAGEVAPTIRETSAGLNFEYARDNTYLTAIEVHGRVDVWATSRITAGVIAASGIDTIRDFEVALQVGFHVEPYDAMKR